MAAYDLRQEAVKTVCEKYGGKACLNEKELIACREVDAFIISLDPFAHPEAFDKIIKAGKPIFLEKPIAPTAERAYQMMKQAQATKVPVQVGFIHRYGPAMPEIQRLLKDKNAGRILSIHYLWYAACETEIINCTNNRPDNFRLRISQIPYHCCHALDVIRLLMGEVKSVYAYAIKWQKWTKRIGWIMGIFLAGMLGSAPGATITWVGSVNSNWDNPLNWSPTNAAPGTNDRAYFDNTVANSCVVPSNTTQTVGALDFRGFSGAGNDRKLIIQPGAALHNMTNATVYVLSYLAGDRGIIEVQSNAMLTSSNCNFHIVSGTKPMQGTINIIGGTLTAGGNTLSMGSGNMSTSQSGYTGAVHVSAGGLLSANTIYVGAGGWGAADVGRGVLTISNEGSRVQCTTFEISPGGWSVGGNGRGTVTIYGGTLNVTTFYNAHAVNTTNGTNVAEFIIRGGQLLVSGSMYNTYAERPTVEFGTVTIASGATNLLVSGDYYQRTNGTLVAEITATSHPPLKVNGIAYLAGTLRVASNSVAQRGQWDIVIGDADTNSGTAGLSGRFNTFDASATAHPANWFLSYTTDKVILSYVPKGTIFSFW